jgi:hypothetical protein
MDRCTYLVAFESPDATSAFGSVVRVSTSWCDEFPHLDGLVQTARNEILAVWCESNGVDRVLMTIWAFETLHKITSCSIPNANALVEGSSCDVLGIWGNGNGGNAIFNAEGKDILTSLDVPETNGAVTAA